MRTEKVKVVFLDTVGLPFHGDSLKNRGLGGSESATIIMARELCKLGMDVAVLCDLEKNTGNIMEYDGVTYMHKNAAEFWKEPVDYLISLRSVLPYVHPDFTEYSVEKGWDRRKSEALVKLSKVKAVWLHDYFFPGEEKLDFMVVEKEVDEIITLSDYHTQYVLNHTQWNKGLRTRHAEILQRAIFQTRNGVVPYIDEVDISAKDKNLFVFNAAIAKGMKSACELWQEIHTTYPDARLKIVGGYYEKPNGEAAFGSDYLALKEQHNGKNNIEFLGVIKQNEVAELFAKASYFLYPSEYPETYGISVLESMYYNTPVIGCRYGSLAQVALDKMCYLSDFQYNLNINDNIKKIRHDKFMAQVRKAYTDNYLRQQKMYACNELKGVVEWDKVALEWKHHMYNKLGLYMDKWERRNAIKTSREYSRLFNTIISNKEDKMTVNIDSYVDSCTCEHYPITVVVAVYNAEKYIRKCLESIINQNYDNYNIRIVNDCSTDSTLNIINEVIFENRDVSINVITNDIRNGSAVENQVKAIQKTECGIIVLVDGDDWLVNDPDIFNCLNELYTDGIEFTYGSMHSVCDNIDLIAQPYPKEVMAKKSYRKHLFNWGMPYTHLRTFSKNLFDKINLDSLKDKDCNYFKAGGDNALFYALIEQAYPASIKCVQRVLYCYNDANPIADRKVTPEEQNATAKTIRETATPLVMAQSQASGTAKNILIGIPCSRSSGDDVRMRSMLSVSNMVCSMLGRTDLKIYTECFYTYNVAQTRNMMMDYAIKYGYDYVLTIDGDMVIPPDTLSKLYSHNVDVVGGLYRQRSGDIPEFYISGKRGTKDIAYEPRLLEVDGIGMGCALIKTSVAKAVGYPYFVYEDTQAYGKTLSEDYNFCYKAKGKGFGIYLDTSIRCGHLSEQILEI